MNSWLREIPLTIGSSTFLNPALAILLTSPAPEGIMICPSTRRGVLAGSLTSSSNSEMSGVWPLAMLCNRFTSARPGTLFSRSVGRPCTTPFIRWTMVSAQSVMLSHPAGALRRFP